MTELFELELLGGDMERRYRALRPEVEQMPWGTLRPGDYPTALVDAARTAWTSAAFQEHRTAVACTATLRAMIEARAPLDLVAFACRFPLDELVHVELCSRLAMELGGAVELHYDPNALIGDLGHHEDPLLRASHLVVAYFCVGEALSIPLLAGTAQAASHPLTREVLRRIVRDEADHGTFGWTWLDWALPLLADHDRPALAATAGRAIAGVREGWEAIRLRRTADESAIHDLGWLGTDDYLARAARALERQVVAPLRERGIPV